MFTLTSFTAPWASFTAFSRTGPNCLQGPHQGAQKSTITGTSRLASNTSAAKVASPESLICGLDGALVAPFCAGEEVTGRPPGPIKAMLLSLSFSSQKMGTQGLKGKPLFFVAPSGLRWPLASYDHLPHQHALHARGRRGRTKPRQY